MPANRLPRLGLKYCGGCRPRHDRVAAAGAVAKALEGLAEVVGHGAEPAPDAYLIVAGCPTACVETEPFAGRPVFVLSNETDPQGLIDQLRAWAAA